MSAQPPIERGILLIVEDNRDLCENFAEILEERGYRVTKAYSARQASEHLRAGARPDVALIDLNLPDRPGLEVLAEIRAASPETACAILTGNASIESAVVAVNRGAYAYLLKGGRIEDVIAMVDRASEKVGLERAKTRLERSLRDERNFSRSIVTSATLGIAVLDPAGRVLELNPQMRTLLGAAAGGATSGDAIVALGRDADSRERLRRALSGDIAARDASEVEVALPGGGARAWRISASCVEGEGGKKDAVVAVFGDMTSERALQRKVLDSSRLAAIGEMAARVAHEIRNPLAGISGAVRVLGRGFESDPKREPFVRELLALVSRLNGFVEDLLVYARPMRMSKEDVTLAALLEPMLAILGEHAAVSGVAIESEDRLEGPLRIDRHYFGMALQNLILNAAQAQRGKGRIRIEAAPAPDGGALVTVADDGPGLSADAIAHLFEAFATTRIEGTGLGLSTTKRIIEAHGGTIAAANRPEGGARFEIVLP